ncbi:MAG: bifunctional proline dehydrogenase/L-glutamate gamma-semialdehyde dehydrogenase PutA [Rhodospirillales bacterium]|nr:bifunctional proline dehydrogenase/L-glutamate gamma-semialdehyde dehydrogenase PutA [Rhodospirillales bacterium]
MTFVFDSLPDRDDLNALRRTYRADENEVVETMLAEARLGDDAARKVERLARDMVAQVRARRRDAGGLDAFMHEYDLSSDEGVALMCLAEALLRVPDPETSDRLIRDKIGDADWADHVGDSESLFVNASTWGLMLTGRIVRLDSEWTGNALGLLGRLVNRIGEPIIREAMVHAMRIIGRQFVMGQTIDEALDRSRDERAKGYRHSFDMLGEAARTMPDADRYMASYEAAIDRLGPAADDPDLFARPSISVKLSALHPRYELSQRERVMAELAPRLIVLAERARDCGIALTVDAEEADRLEISLELFGLASGSASLAGWDGLGLAVQAYQKRAVHVLDFLADMAARHGRRIPVRLVKGAYWDTEIKLSQEQGLDGYPVFTRKASTDVSYIACARRLLGNAAAFYPQFATHNAQTLATILMLAGSERRDFEFQRLHGMGQALYERLVEESGRDISCRIYAPVGSHEDLLAYLVRRLLENGANTSFVNRIVDDAMPIERLVESPVAAVSAIDSKPHPRIVLPRDLFGPGRRNSKGLDLSDVEVLGALARDMGRASETSWRAAPLIGGEIVGGTVRTITNPADRRDDVGEVAEANVDLVDQALSRAHAAARAWSDTPADERASCLERFADRLEQNMAQAMAIACREAGKTLADGVAEVREAVDFCRYYAARARDDFAAPVTLPGPTGETNTIALHGRGVFVCISPWNFPLAIFCGQVTAALAAGNAVIAKPAEQTPLMALFAARLLHEAGVPGDVLHLLPGDGATVGAALVADPRVAGVAFTGSTETAQLINRKLAERSGPIVPLIAETGGQNAMIVDSTALPEQVTADVIHSAVNSAGQRCSALRVLCLQEEVADKTIAMLTGAMAELKVGDPALLATDVGPVIDDEAKGVLEAHVARMGQEATVIYRSLLGPETEYGTFVAPTVIEIDALSRLEREVFGPVLHVMRFSQGRLDDLIDAINGTGYGLTLGIHTRIDSVAEHIADRAEVGNIYVNRNMIGAIVGSQPFGGERLSGTGPKAGGPRYLHRFATERVVSTDTTAAGGNAGLMTLDD